MKKNDFWKTIFLSVIGMVTVSEAKAEVDPNFYVYLCIGQSNMEGQGQIYSADKKVDERFLMMSPIDFGGRKKGVWQKAVPPLCRYNTGLCPADYFGRTMLEHLPENVRIGVINVSVAGCGIDLFHPENCDTYIKNWAKEGWQIERVNAYDRIPLQKLLDAAKLAQQDGVIKGILLHQGETDAYNDQWLTKVKRVYENILEQLSLSADSVPLIAGEAVGSDQNGQCASANTTINKLPKKISTAHVVSSKGCTAQSDHLHFSSAGYRELGKRYAEKMLELMGIDMAVQQPTVSTASDAYYSLDGRQLQGLQRGLNIVRKGGQVRKVLVK